VQGGVRGGSRKDKNPKLKDDTSPIPALPRRRNPSLRNNHIISCKKLKNTDIFPFLHDLFPNGWGKYALLYRTHLNLSRLSFS